MFSHGQTVIRERRPKVPNPANPQRPLLGQWDEAGVTTLELPGAWVASSSSSESSSATRSDILTLKSLFLTDVSADVLPGDRIRYGTSIGYVKVTPEADVNPFTGWQPYKEIPLETSEG